MFKPSKKNHRKEGKVYFIGAGPGDPSLITLKAFQYLKKADVIVYDHLASSQLLNYIPQRAEFIYVGKKGGESSISQEEINKILVTKALEGKNIIRLKGGDPCILGRGGEEGLTLAKKGIKFEIIPGITSAIAGPIYAGIPLTHRGLSSKVTILTGHQAQGQDIPQQEFNLLAKEKGTIIFLMAMKKLKEITSRLIEAGKNPHTPAAVITQATLPQQKIVEGTIQNIVKKTKEAELKAPAVIIIGEVVKLRKYLQWFEPKPLSGIQALITRNLEQSKDMIEKLQELGANVFLFPTIQILPPLDLKPLKRTLSRLFLYDWILFTSQNSVIKFFEILKECKKDARALKDIKIAAIGPQTQKTLLNYGIQADLIPPIYTSEGMLSTILKHKVKGKRFLLPRVKGASKLLPQGLRENGAIVEEIEAYRTESYEPPYIEEIKKLLKEKRIQVVIFSSPSTIKNFVSLFGSEIISILSKNTSVATIGPVTKKSAEDLGIQVRITPQRYTINDMIEAILHYFSSDKKNHSYL
jgi:uroporphyrinogen III methyltransferase/synthase